MRTFLATAGLLAAAVLVLGSMVPILAQASQSVSLDLRLCFLFCLAKDLKNLFEPRRVETEVAIEQYPEAWRKRDPVEVAGRVTGRDGTAVPDVVVELYLNRTKSEPGELLGTARTDDTGWWRFEGAAPASLPPGDYQLVARSLESRSLAVIYLEGWSDPEVDMWSGTRFELTSDWERGGWTVTARLVDDAGAPVPGAPLRWSAEGRPAGSSRTDPAGMARQEFPGPGPRTVTVAFAGRTAYEPAEGEILLPPPTLVLARTTLGALPGQAAVLRGQTDAGLTVEVEGAAVATAPDGSFEARLAPREAAGVYKVEARSGPTVRSATLHVGLPLAVALQVDRLNLLGANAEVEVTSGGAPVAGAAVLVQAGGTEVPVRTDASGRAQVRIPLDRGEWPIRAVATAPGHLADGAETSASVKGWVDLALPALAAAAAAVGLAAAPLALRGLRPPARLALSAPNRALAGEELTLQVHCAPGGPVEIEATFEARTVRMGTVAAPMGEVRLVPPAPGVLRITARRLPTADCRGGRMGRTVLVESYADALERAGQPALAREARWGPPRERREVWKWGGSPA